VEDQKLNGEGGDFRVLINSFRGISDRRLLKGRQGSAYTGRSAELLRGAVGEDDQDFEDNSSLSHSLNCLWAKTRPLKRRKKNGLHRSGLQACLS